MIAWQVPAPQIFGNLQPMPGAEMTAQGLAPKAAFEADDIISANRLPFRQPGFPLLVCPVIAWYTDEINAAIWVAAT